MNPSLQDENSIDLQVPILHKSVERYSNVTSPVEIVGNSSNLDLLHLENQGGYSALSRSMYPFGASSIASPMSQMTVKKGAMDGALGGKHLAEYLPSNKPPRGPKKLSNSRSPDRTGERPAT